MERRQYLCRGIETTEMRLSNETIATCVTYKYLEINFKKEGKDDEEIISRISKEQ